MKFKYILKSVFVWGVLAISWTTFFPIFFILWLLSRPIDRKRYFIHWLTARWSYFYIWISPSWDLRIEGKEKIPYKKPRVYISNHQSMLDIAVLYQVYPHYLWVSKTENYKTPVLGWVMSLNGYLKVDRKNPRSFPKMFEDCSNALKNGDSIIIFPEGTRSINGELGRYKEGAFKIAIENKAAIVPIVLDGTGSLLPKKGLVFGGSKIINIHVLDEVPYEKFPSNEPMALKEYFKELMSTELNKIRNINI